ncbi:hypothetical protein RJ639_000615 [Escallonia herrerae]|uniref:Retrotransposon gag domain-containing protein n=1 Tax=Escallonia herrerae TaxID=1293975 RepID=A0AA88XD27_9ASTE|nr:hypothetical protein RJ639_000615 [Escallonia herrerae]
MEDSTNSPPVLGGEIGDRRCANQRHCPQGRIHAFTRKVHPQGRTSHKTISEPHQVEFTPLREDSGYPLSKTIEKAKLPHNFRMPQYDLYDGSGDPGEHVYQFQTNMLLLQVSDAVMCRAFPTTLRKAAHAWFKSLQLRSIHSFAQLFDLFQKHFVSSRTRRKNLASLLNVVQERNNESLSRYLGRFNAVTIEIDSLDESVKYTAFMRGLQSPGSMNALLDKANKYIHAEEYLETHKGHREDNGQEQEKRAREDSPRGGRGSKRSRRDERSHKEMFDMKNLTPLTARPLQILHEIKDKEILEKPDKMSLQCHSQENSLEPVKGSAVHVSSEDEVPYGTWSRGRASPDQTLFSLGEIASPASVGATVSPDGDPNVGTTISSRKRLGLDVRHGKSFMRLVFQDEFVARQHPVSKVLSRDIPESPLLMVHWEEKLDPCRLEDPQPRAEALEELAHGLFCHGGRTFPCTFLPLSLGSLFQQT